MVAELPKKARARPIPGRAVGRIDFIETREPRPSRPGLFNRAYFLGPAVREAAIKKAALTLAMSRLSIPRATNGRLGPQPSSRPEGNLKLAYYLSVSPGKERGFHLLTRVGRHKGGAPLTGVGRRGQ